MRIALASDHAGYAFKEELAKFLAGLGHEVEDFGTDSEASCDYPDFAIPAAQTVPAGGNQRAILICTNGIGMAMAANRIPGVRAALVYSQHTARMTRAHHDSNVLCLGAGEFSAQDLLGFARIWLETAFDGGRHERRIEKFQKLERA